jgi:hypothetical protein
VTIEKQTPKMKTKLNLMEIWKQNQHLNFCEIRRVVAAGEEAIRQATWKETKAKFSKKA